MKERFRVKKSHQFASFLMLGMLLSYSVTPLQALAGEKQNLTGMEQSKPEEKKTKVLKSEDKKFVESKKDDTTPSTNAAIENNAPCQSWVDPFKPVTCCLLCIHGLGLNSGSYNNFGQRMASHGIATYAIDVRGFGSWMLAKGHSEVDFESCLDDVQVALKSIRAAHPGKIVFLLGESMGGAIALKATALHPELVDGLISSVPSGDRFKQKKTDLKVALEFLTGPNRQHNIGKTVIEQATKNEKLRDDWADDPLDRMDLSAKELIQFQKFMNENHDSAKLITSTPVLVIQGTNDKLAKPEGTWEIFTEIQSKQKDFFAVPSEHLIFEDAQDHGASFDEKISSLVDAWIFSQWELVDKAQIETRRASLDVRREGRLEVLKTQRPLLDWIKNTSLKIPASSQTLLPPTLLKSVGIAGHSAVLAFYAPWAEECKGIDSFFAQPAFAQAGMPRLTKINVDNHDNDELVKACSVGPIPTFVYVTADGHIAATNIGKNNFFDLAKGLKAANH